MSGWSGVAGAYRASFATLCSGTVDRLLADAADGPLLDVGAGTGELAARAAAAGRRVVAVDADPAMVAVTAEVVPGRVALASLPRLPLADDTVATTTANFVVNHVAEPRAAARELARVTRPGGRVAMTTWTAAPPAWGGLVADAFAAAGATAPPAARLAPELDFERSPAGLARLAEEAGLATLAATELRWTWEVGVDALWAGVAGGVAGPGRTYLAQPPAVRAAATDAYRAAAVHHPGHRPGPHGGRGVLRLAAVAAYVLAEA